MDMKEKALEALRSTIPPAFPRCKIDKFLPGIISRKTLANLHSAGEGPPFFMIGNKAVYDRDVFFEWLSKR
jgi:hypothetical protein